VTYNILIEQANCVCLSFVYDFSSYFLPVYFVKDVEWRHHTINGVGGILGSLHIAAYSLLALAFVVL
jgi:hypothetical protein